MLLPEYGHRKLLLAVGVGAACLIVVLLMVLATIALRYRKLFCHRSSSADDFKPPRKRVVVVMHSNSLYDSSPTKDSGSLAPLLLPLVRIEGGKGRLPSDVISVSDYEIPLDREWEFPRERFVRRPLIVRFG
jgi:hypothetical protein